MEVPSVRSCFTGFLNQQRGLKKQLNWQVLGFSWEGESGLAIAES